MRRVAPVMAMVMAMGLVLASPALAQAPACPIPGQAPMLLVRLYFGQTIPGPIPGPNGGLGVVSRRAWQRFVAERVTAALPDGFTVLDAYGQFRDPATGAVGREATEIVEVAAPDTPEFRARIGAVADAYKRQFRQSAVGIVSKPVCGLF